MRNILFISHSSELNGAELALLDLVRRLDRRRFNPFLIVPEPGPLIEAARKSGVGIFVIPSKWSLTVRSKIWRQPLSRIWNRRSVSRISGLIRENNIHLVFTNSAANWCGALAAKQNRIPHVWHIHEILDGRAPLLFYFAGKRRLVRKMRNLSSRIIANSAASARAFRASGDVVIIPNGIDIGRGIEMDRVAVGASLGLGVDAMAIGIVGKIYPEKGQRETILALKFLLPRFPGLKLLVIGEARDKSYFRALRRLVRNSGLEKDVIFTGYREDLPVLLRLLKALVVASSVDSFGRAALEAMASGLPVLAVDKGGLPELVTHLTTGYLIDSQTPEAIAAGLTLILEDSVLAREIGESGKRFVEKNFAVEDQIRKIEQVLESCLES